MAQQHSGLFRLFSNDLANLKFSAMARLFCLLFSFCWSLFPYFAAARTLPDRSTCGSLFAEKFRSAPDPMGKIADLRPAADGRLSASSTDVFFKFFSAKKQKSDRLLADGAPSPCLVSADFAIAFDYCNGLYTATSTATGNGSLSYEWNNIASGPNFTAQPFPGANTLCLTVTNLTAGGSICRDTVCQTFEWPANGPMTVAIAGQGSCGQYDLAAAVAGGAAPFSFLWSNGAATALHTVTSSGTYCVTVTDANNCTATACRTVSVGTPIPIFFDQSPGGNCSVRILSLLWAWGSRPGTYAWSNGDNSFFTTVASDGTYCLTYTDLNGCQSVACTTVTVPTPPTVAFTSALTSPTNCLRMNYTSSVSGGNGPFTYAWNLVGTAQLNSPSPNLTNIVYTATGLYPVCVTVTDVYGCTATACQQVQVGQTCTLDNVDFCTTVEPSGTNRFRVTVSDVVHNCNGTATLQYSFNGGATWGNSSSFLASVPGSIIVCVRVHCAVCGQTCTRTGCKNVQINAPCNIPATATLSVTVNPTTRVATFTASALSPAAMDYQWDFDGNGTIDAATTANVVTNSYAYGTHQACVTIRRSANCSKSICRTVIIQEPCNVTANFSARHCTDNPLTVNFTGLATNNTSVQWIFGDGNISFANNPTHTYAAAGAYTVELYAYKPNSNCLMRVLYTVIVGPKNCDGNNPPANMTVNDNGEETAEEAGNTLLETDGSETTEQSLDGLGLFPNPASERAHLVFDLDQAHEVQVTVLDINGKALLNLQSPATDGRNLITIPTERLGQGLYLVRLHAGGTVLTTKLLIQR